MVLRRQDPGVPFETPSPHGRKTHARSPCLAALRRAPRRQIAADGGASVHRRGVRRSTRKPRRPRVTLRWRSTAGWARHSRVRCAERKGLPKLARCWASIKRGRRQVNRRSLKNSLFLVFRGETLRTPIRGTLTSSLPRCAATFSPRRSTASVARRHAPRDVAPPGRNRSIIHHSGRYTPGDICRSMRRLAWSAREPGGASATTCCAMGMGVAACLRQDPHSPRRASRFVVSCR
jgi:hypothetical protein